MSKRTDELVQAICGTGEHPLAPVLSAWCDESRAFRDFVEAHATKIRKKARGPQGNGEIDDLLAELAVAARFAADRSFGVLYEPKLASGERGPDFEVSFKGHTTIQVEVTRLRSPPSPDGLDLPRRLARVLCDKIGQFPAGSPNLLAAVIPAEATAKGLVVAALGQIDGFRLGDRASSRGLHADGVRDFQRQRHRLSAVVLLARGDAWRLRTTEVWLNTQARHALPAEVTKYLLAQS